MVKRIKIQWVKGYRVGELEDVIVIDGALENNDGCTLVPEPMGDGSTQFQCENDGSCNHECLVGVAKIPDGPTVIVGCACKKIQEQTKL